MCHIPGGDGRPSPSQQRRILIVNCFLVTVNCFFSVLLRLSRITSLLVGALTGLLLISRNLILFLDCKMTTEDSVPKKYVAQPYYNYNPKDQYVLEKHCAVTAHCVMPSSSVFVQKQSSFLQRNRKCVIITGVAVSCIFIGICVTIALFVLFFNRSWSGNQTPYWG